jgi:hypothetical protein
MWPSLHSLLAHLGSDKFEVQERITKAEGGKGIHNVCERGIGFIYWWCIYNSWLY